ncbi:hypothetical protein GCM10028857_01100 [Salinarchaeum chitinilyticum]
MIVGLFLAIVIPLVVIGAQRFRVPPSIQEKRRWLYLVALQVWILSIIGVYGVETQPYFAALPAIVGASVGACLVIIYTHYAFGSID